VGYEGNEMEHRRMPREVSIGFIMFVAALLCSLAAYFAVSGRISRGDYDYYYIRTSMQDVVSMLTAFNMVSLFLGTFAGYLLGRYLHRNESPSLPPRT
jgi:hypothetical protein